MGQPSSTALAERPQIGMFDREVDDAKLEETIASYFDDQAAHRRFLSVPVISSELRWEVFDADNFTCRECGRRRDLTIDHIVPKSKGGPTERANLRTLCRSCNSRKGDRT